MEAKRPKGFGQFDNLMRKLVKVPGSAMYNGETQKEREARWREEGMARQTLEDALFIVEAINELRREEGASVLICCTNPEGSGPDNEAVEVASDWTNWQPHRFGGSTLRIALENAMQEKKLAKERK